jgi:hypothetical protein
VGGERLLVDGPAIAGRGASLHPGDFFTAQYRRKHEYHLDKTGFTRHRLNILYTLSST